MESEKEGSDGDESACVSVVSAVDVEAEPELSALAPEHVASPMSVTSPSSAAAAGSPAPAAVQQPGRASAIAPRVRLRLDYDPLISANDHERLASLLEELFSLRARCRHAEETAARAEGNVHSLRIQCAQQKHHAEKSLRELKRAHALSLRAVSNSLELAQQGLRKLEIDVQKNLTAQLTYERRARHALKSDLDKVTAEKEELDEKLEGLRVELEDANAKAKEYKGVLGKMQKELDSQKQRYLCAAATAAEAKKQAKAATKTEGLAQQAAASASAEQKAEAQRVADLGAQLKSCRNALQAAQELANDRVSEAEQAADERLELNEFIPPPQPDWEHLASLASASTRLSEAKRRDMRYLVHILSVRKWRSQEVVAALDDVNLLSDPVPPRTIWASALRSLRSEMRIAMNDDGTI
eukprot:3566059-Pleurochrysis_carterae.AAC.1